MAILNVNDTGWWWIACWIRWSMGTGVCKHCCTGEDVFSIVAHGTWQAIFACLAARLGCGHQSVNDNGTDIGLDECL